MRSMSHLRHFGKQRLCFLFDHKGISTHTRRAQPEEQRSGPVLDALNIESAILRSFANDVLMAVC